MKFVLLILAVLLPSSFAEAQDVCPEFANIVNVIIKGGTAGKELAQERAIAKQKKKGLYRGWDQSIRLEGVSAKYAVKSTHAFAFKPAKDNIHPRQQIKLYAFKPSKGYRELIVGGTTQFGGSKDRRSQDDSIPLKFKKLGGGCYQVVSSSPLPKGEYAFSLGSGAEVQATNAGWGTDVEGQVWYGFAIK